MYLGDLGQGDRFRIIGNLGGRRLTCPTGSREESRGRLGTNQEYVWCYRAPPPPARPPQTTISVSVPTTTTVSPGIQTAISPQISPTMAQAQASPGASVSAQPVQSMPGGQTADTSYRPGLTGEQVAMIMDAERRAREAEAKQAAQAEVIQQQQRQKELEAFRKTYEDAARDQSEAMQREIEAEQARRAAIEMADTEAQAGAQSSAMYIPPPPSMMPMTASPAPSGPPMTAPNGEPGTAPQARTPWGMILLAVGAVGIVAAGAANKRKGRR